MDNLDFIWDIAQGFKKVVHEFTDLSKNRRQSQIILLTDRHIASLAILFYLFSIFQSLLLVVWVEDTLGNNFHFVLSYGVDCAQKLANVVPFCFINLAFRSCCQTLRDILYHQRGRAEG